jgi:hypothetical protein
MDDFFTNSSGHRALNHGGRSKNETIFLVFGVGGMRHRSLAVDCFWPRFLLPGFFGVPLLFVCT